MGYVLRSNTTWGPMYYSDSIEGTVDKKKAAVFDSEDEARKFLKTFDWLILKDIKHDKVEIVKEECKMKGLKEFIKTKKLNEDKVVVIHTKGGKVDYIEKGEYFAGPHGKMFVRDAGVDFKAFVGMDPNEAKNSLVKFSRFDPKSIIIEGCKKVQEATSNLREGFGELEVYTSFGPGFGVQIYPSRNGELTAHVGYVGSSSGNGTRKKDLKTETEFLAQDQIKVSDLKQIERVLKKHLDALDSDLEKTLKQLGYK